MVQLQEHKVMLLQKETQNLLKHAKQTEKMVVMLGNAIVDIQKRLKELEKNDRDRHTSGLESGSGTIR